MGSEPQNIVYIKFALTQWLSDTNRDCILKIFFSCSDEAFHKMNFMVTTKWNFFVRDFYFAVWLRRARNLSQKSCLLLNELLQLENEIMMINLTHKPGKCINTRTHNLGRNQRQVCVTIARFTLWAIKLNLNLENTMSI